MGTAGFLLCVACGDAATQQPIEPVVTGTPMERVSALLTYREPELIALRHDLHRNPEVSGSEARTSRIVADRLSALGLEVHTGVGGYGVVGILRGARSGPLIAYRADMDAVFSNDPDPVDFRSVNAGVRHVCGHDVHTTIGLALASTLSAIKADLAGSVMFIFQPAEERATGARAMLSAGVFDGEKPVAIFGVHTSPYEVGVLGTRAGGLMASRDAVTITLTGSGDRATAAAAARQLVESLGTITAAQQFQPAPDDVVFVQLNPDQVSASSVTVRASITLASNTVRERVAESIARGVAALAIPGVNPTQVYTARQIAGVTNDSALTARAVESIKRAVGDGVVRQVTSVIPAFSEDFGSFQERVPGVFLFLGVSNSARGLVGMPHSPGYAADDGAITFGARVMAAVLLDHLGAGSGASR